MDKDQLISFVMPAYNCEATIAEAVDSIFVNNFQAGDELIIVNDCASDATDKVMAELMVKYPVIKYLKNDHNQGCPATRNIGIKAATNPLIFNLDADDVLAPGSVAKLKHCLLSNQADLVAFGESHYFSKSIKEVTHLRIYKYGLMSLADYLAGPVVPGGNYLYTKASWERLGGYWEFGAGLHEYWGFSLKQIASGSKFMVATGTHYYHRYGGDSLYARELHKEVNSLVATKMIEPYLDLLCQADADYIRSERGSREWFDLFSSKRPLHLKDGSLGHTGYQVAFQSIIPTWKIILKKYCPAPLYLWLKQLLAS